MCGVTAAVGTAVLVGAGRELGRQAMDYAIKHPDKLKEEVEAGWKRDREAGGISSWDNQSKTATA